MYPHISQIQKCTEDCAFLIKWACTYLSTYLCTTFGAFYTHHSCLEVNSDRNSGVIKQNSFAHVTYTTDRSGEIILRCTCDIYEFIQSTAHQENSIWPLEDIVPHTSFTSPHCQFYKDHLPNAYTTVLSQPIENLPPALAMVKKSLGYINKPYVLMGKYMLYVLHPVLLVLAEPEEDQEVQEKC